MSKRRILFVIRYHYLRRTGGAELQCWMLAKEFARRGWDVHYLSENDRPDAPRELDGVTLHYLPENPVWHDSNRAGVERVMRELQPDVVYNRVYNLYTALAVEFAPKHTVTVWAAAAAYDGRILGLFADMWQTKSLKQYLILLPEVFFIRARARRWALRAKLQLAQSLEQAERLRRHGFRPELLRNSIEFGETNLQTHNGRPVVLWVGSVKKYKRPEIFYELARRCQDLDCEFVMAGEVQDEQSREPLERAQRELKQFRYAGFVAPELIGKLYDRAHLFVSTSRAEGFANTFIQAWLRGIPVVSLDVNPDQLLSTGGLGAAASTVDVLEQKLREFIQRPDLRRESGARAREFTLKEFNLHANVDRLEELIRARM